MTLRRSILSSAAAAVLLLAGSAQAAPAFRILDRIAGPDARWDYVRVDGAVGRVLVAQGESVTAFDLATRAVTPGIAPGQRLHDALPVNGGAELLVTQGGSDSAIFVDARTGALLATVKTGKGPDAADLDPATGLVLVMDHAGGDVTLVDPKTRTDVGTIMIGGAMEAAAFDGKGMAFVNVEDRNEIAVLDLKGRKVVARHKLAGCDGPTGLAYDAADGLLIAACDGTTAFMQAATGKVTQTLPTGAGADGVAFDAKRGLAFVSAGGDGVLSVVQVTHGKAAIVQKLATQKSGRTIALDEKTGRVYIPVARFGAAPAGGGRGAMVPGSFELLVIGR
jgi:DNA-binding beta-propeller fold protein YncE